MDPISILPSITELPLPAIERAFFQKYECYNPAIPKLQFMKRVGPVKGAWSPEEDDILRRAVACSTPVLWDVVAKAVKGRTPKQCRERWMYRLHPELKKTPFEQWEDDLIYHEKKAIGNKWTQIALKLPGRTSCSVKNRWYTVLRNRYGAESDEGSSSSSNDIANQISIDSLLNKPYH